MIIAARSTVTGVRPEASTRSTSRREERCSESPGPISPRPPRYTILSRPASSAARANSAAIVRSCSAYARPAASIECTR